MNDIAHLGPVELFTPTGEESLRFFVDVLGMEIEHQGARPRTCAAGATTSRGR